MIRLLDAHNHTGVHITGGYPHISICNGTGPDDWKDLKTLALSSPEKVIPYYGVHPWYIDSAGEDFIDQLTAYLEENAGGVGEIGLDRSKGRPDIDLQKKSFILQLEKAAELILPVTVHCVRAWGLCIGILEDVYAGSNLPFMIHSFSGSEEIMERIVKLGGFLSFGPELGDAGRTRLINTFKRTPLERILLETDYTGKESIDDGGTLRQLYFAASGLKEIDFDELAGIVWENGKVFTDRTSFR